MSKEMTNDARTINDAMELVKELFIAFRATPNLFGLPTQTTGFNQQEYDGAFKLYNKAIVMPIQKTIIRTLEDIIGVENCVEIEQFKIDFDA